MLKLGVNIDHVATLRQARRESEPDPIAAALICEKAGANSIVAHLREDRRHINDTDVKTLRKIITTRFNLEMSINPGIVSIACAIKPDQATLVPEHRQEITTEGGLDVLKNSSVLQKGIVALEKHGIAVSLFIDPTKNQIKQAHKIGAKIIELHTGRYARAKTKIAIERELNVLRKSAEYAKTLGLVVNAGHGLNYENVTAITQIPGMTELNIGHAIIARAVFVGLGNAVTEMVHLTR